MSEREEVERGEGGGKRNSDAGIGLIVEIELFSFQKRCSLSPLFRSLSLSVKRNLLTSAVTGAGELLREARRDDCRRRFADEGSAAIAVAKPLLLLWQIALAATAPGVARRWAALAEQREEEIKLARMVTR